MERIVEYRQLGRSGVKVSVLSLGTMPFGGHQRPAKGNVDVNEARRILDHALDAGVNLIDTADVYGYGRSELTLGKIIEGRRDRILIATKCRAIVGDGPNDAGLSRYHIIQSLERSLQRLGTDHVDLYQVHGWDGQTPLEETIRALDQLVRDGKVRYVGCSNLAAWHVMKSLAVADKLSAERFVSQQIYYSLIDRDAENELVPVSIDQGVGILVWGPLAGGLLSGKYQRGVDDAKLLDWIEPPIHDPGRIYDIVDVVREVADTHGSTPAQVSLAYILAKPGVTSAILGPRREADIVTALKAADLKLTSDDLARLDAASARPQPYPQWHFKYSAFDRLGPGDTALVASEWAEHRLKMVHEGFRDARP
jgi:aryl-alcohol dehydrogenase-like predicted oxidoreductase